MSNSNETPSESGQSGQSEQIKLKSAKKQRILNAIQHTQQTTQALIQESIKINDMIENSTTSSKKTFYKKKLRKNNNKITDLLLSLQRLDELHNSYGE